MTAERYATALLETTARYHRRCLSHATWKSHMRALWNVVEAKGLTAEVLTLVDPAKVGLRPIHEAKDAEVTR